MARARAGGGAAYAVALVIFVALFVFSLIAAILFYTQLDATRQDARVAREQLATYVSPVEQRAPEIAALASSNSGKTVIAQLAEENRELKRAITGSPGDTLPAVKTAMTTLGMEEGVAMRNAIQKLKLEVADREKRVQDAEAAAAEARTQAANLAAEKADGEAKFRGSVDELQTKLDALQQQNAAFVTKASAANSDVEKQLNDVRAATRDEVNKLGAQIAQLQKDAVAKDQKIAELITQLSNRQKLGSVVAVDGKIVTLQPDQPVVYVDLGRSDRLMLGMTFEVFDRNSVIKLDEFGDMRGKATVEVIDIQENSAAARIVRLDRGKTLAEGDSIVNAVYDRNVSARFYVYGDFDIDSTGQATVSDRRRVETMVTQWGGRVAPRLDYDVDYLVLGVAPPMPEKEPEGGDFDPELTAIRAAQQKIYDQYEELKRQAQALSIPILNQNRFLNLVGYYQR